MSSVTEAPMSRSGQRDANENVSLANAKTQSEVTGPGLDEEYCESARASNSKATSVQSETQPCIEPYKSHEPMKVGDEYKMPTVADQFRSLWQPGSDTMSEGPIVYEAFETRQDSCASTLRALPQTTVGRATRRLWHTCTANGGAVPRDLILNPNTSYRCTCSGCGYTYDSHREVGLDDLDPEETYEL